MNRRRSPLPAAALVAALGLAAAGAGPAPAAGETVVPRSYLVLAGVSRGGRAPVHVDAEEARIVAGTWQPPHDGETLTLSGGASRSWRAASASQTGELQAPPGAYAYTSVASANRRVMVLEASGDGVVCVNGEPRVGDPYATGYVRLPVLLRAGGNDLLFQVARGGLKAKLETPKAEALLSTGDLTLPDLIRGRAVPGLGAVVVLNAADQTAGRLRLRCSRARGRTLTTDLPPIPPLGIRKVAFHFDGRAPEGIPGDHVDLELRLEREGRVLDTATVPVRVRQPGESYKRAFVSEIDGSVQYYAVRPALPRSGDRALRAPAPALFLTLHGAGVEAIGQVDAYSSKSWGALVAPTNRRPYGFDWEDWGRLDALEVLEQAKAELHPDPRRTYLTGHSMGGHGTWNVAANFPDRFAAIGPSAGWISFWSYAGAARSAPSDPLSGLFQRATSAGDTLGLGHNYGQLGVYVLHGGADDNVPVEEARTMVRFLTGWHHDFTYHEQPGAGHWWDVSDEPGADCVDWPPMFDLFARHERPDDADVRDIDFSTANPGVSARCRWLEVEAQAREGEISRVVARFDPGKRRFTGTTENVARLCFFPEDLGASGPFEVDLDGTTLTGISASARLTLERAGDRWRVSEGVPPGWKGPARYGPFKDAFRHRMLFVYGTRGTPEDNAWALAKARFDAESFWYRGNGSIDVLPDTAFRPEAEPDRGVILYGNADTNAAWPALLGGSPVQVRRGAVQVGSRAERGADLACLFVRPRPGSDRALVAAVSGTGPAGMRLTDRLPYFLSGVGYPDVTVLGPETLSRGMEAVRAAGYFGADWSVPGGEFCWREGAADR